ncbi:phenylalanine N-monooxygenase CYP79D16-like [Euphorbia lathyris]|uniref:phenylalanine N-monooxygenase CYP79D16-like n=1 Tax=Euphorbia lathyris TaxID=212925 RepID=UPI003313FD13
MENILFIFLSFFIILFFLKFLKFRDRKSTKLPLPPGPKPWPILGCLPTMLINKPVFRWIHNLMNELDTEIACIRLGNVHVIPVTCPNISCQFLKEQDSVFATRPLMMSTQIASSGYLTTVLVPVGDQWMKMKRVLVSEMLSPSKQKLFYTKRLEEANHLVRYVYDQCLKCDDGCGLVNVRFVSRHYCANLIRNILFNRRSFREGKNNGGPSFEDEEHVKAIFTMLAYIYGFSVSDYLPCLQRLDLDCHGKIMKEANRILRKYQNPIIEERFKKWSNGNNKEVEDLLDMFITLKDANGYPLLSKEEIQAQITEIMIEVVDNPSNVVEWALAEMINQPEILSKAVEELDRVVGKERLVEESDFSQLNYIKACAREALRLHPMAPFNVPHVAVADTTVCNYFIPKGSHVLLSRMGLGRNSKVWDEPEKFKPERHLKNERCSQVTLSEPNLRFISFSTGKRSCPGIEMGTLMTMMLFARLLQGFRWNPPSNQTSIDLTESTNSLALANPLVAVAFPRLPPHLCPA